MKLLGGSSQAFGGFSKPLEDLLEPLWCHFYRVFHSDCLLKKRRFSACFHLGKCGKAATYSLDTPILGEECEDLLSLTILASFDTLFKSQIGIFSKRRISQSLTLHLSLRGKKAECATETSLCCLINYSVYLGMCFSVFMCIIESQGWTNSSPQQSERCAIIWQNFSGW